MTAGVILTVRHFPLDADLVQHKILCEHVLDVCIYLTDRIDIFSHTSFASTPLINAGDSSVPYFLAGSTASLMATPTGTSSSYFIS